MVIECTVPNYLGAGDLFYGHAKAANYADVIAVPQGSLPDGHAMRERVGVRQLDFLDDFAARGIMLKERVQI